MARMNRKTRHPCHRPTTRPLVIPVVWVLAAASALLAGKPCLADEPALASVSEMAAAREDVWAEAAIRAPGGPSFEFFRDLLPPLRYANTDFRHYPIMLGAPRAAAKARWISNGSAVNARANKKPMWREIGTPVHFFVGTSDEPFGADLERLDDPRYAEGYLPIVQCAYRVGDARFEQEVFAPVEPELAGQGAVLLRFRATGSAGKITVRIQHEGELRQSEHSVQDDHRQTLVSFGGQWQWDVARKQLTVELAKDAAAYLAVFTVPAAEGGQEWNEKEYQRRREACVREWTTLLDGGVKIDLPEAIVQDAWRSLVVGNYLLAVGDRMHYSAGNAYDHLYEAECGDAVRSLLLFGQETDARRMLGPLLAFQRQATRFHVAGHKLQLLAFYYWQTHDAAYVREQEAAWSPVVELITGNLQPNGLLPPDNYAGDIKQQVVSLSSNSTCWRGLRDLAAVLDDLGDHDRAKTLFAVAAGLREAILDLVAKCERHDVQPPFIPISLAGDEPPHDPLTATRIGSYYDLMAPYVIGAGVFAPGSERETWMIDYLRRHGGVALGMIRSTPHQGEFDNQPGVNVLYGLRYMLALLRRDDTSHALAGFYGQLAQAMTRKTFIGGEGSRFLHGDRFGRSFYLPPNSASNATFLTVLRYLMIQDWDLNDDGRPETLRLLHAVPARWLADGSTLRVSEAPTAFGKVSLEVCSRLKQGDVTVVLDVPSRAIEKLLLRLPLPAGWRVDSVEPSSATVVREQGGDWQITPKAGQLKLRFHVSAGS